MNIDDTVAIISGGASGLGEGTVRRMVALGASVAVLDLAEEAGESLAKELGKRAIFVKTDVVDADSVKKAIQATVNIFGRVNAVINCAGILGSGKVYGRNGAMPLSNYTRVIDVNLNGAFNVVRLAVEQMVKNTPNHEGERGVIVNTASVAAFDGQIGQAAYSAAKGGIVSMMLPLAREFAQYGIRVIGIAPGYFNTPMTEGMSEEVRISLEKTIPFPQRLGKPSEFANLVQFILENPLMNGTTIRIDGALRMQAK